MNKKPVIGITRPDKKSFWAFTAIKIAVRVAGGNPLTLKASRDYKNVRIDGLLLGGGADIFPGFYDRPPKKEYIYDHERDDMELYWGRRALEEQIPALGICRGAQLMNVVCGGTLHADIRKTHGARLYPDDLLHHAFYRKRINIVKDSLLHGITGADTLKVNSIHKQAVDKLGDGLEINATEDNEVVQAISLKEHPFYLGVQFHPEFLIYSRVFRKLFGALVNIAKG